MKKINKKEIMPLVYGMGGGVVGMQLTNFVERQGFASSNPMIAPGIVMILSAFAAISGIGKSPAVKEMAKGAAIVAGSELGSKIANTAMGQLQGIISPSLGYDRVPKTLGFEPVVNPQNTSVGLNSVAIR